MSEVKTESQTHMDEQIIEDEDLIRDVVTWAGFSEKKKPLAKQVRDLDKQIDVVKGRVMGKLHDFGIDDAEEPVSFRAGGTNLVIEFVPEGQPKTTTSTPKRRVVLKLSKE